MRRLRQMEPRDLAAVGKIAQAQNRRDGTSYPVPPVFDARGRLLPTVAMALVTERWNGQVWRVRQAHVWLRTVEQMDFGGGHDDTEFAIGHLPLVAERLRSQGYVDMHVFVPKVRVGELENLLQGQRLNRVDERLAHFFTILERESEGEDVARTREPGV